MPISAKLDLSLTFSQSGAGNFGDGPYYNPQIALLQALTNGVSANQADLFYCAERIVASGANDDMDLTGVLKGALGENLNFARIVAIMLVNMPKLASAPANTTNLTLGGAPTNAYFGFVGAATHTVGPFRPGGGTVLFNSDGTALGAVTAGTGDILRVANSAGAAATYQIAILGRSS